MSTLHKLASLALAITSALMLLIVLLITTMPVQSVQANSTIRYVSVSDPTCGGQAPCYKDIQLALDAANNNDVIKVAAGVYTNTRARLVDTRVLTQVVLLINKSVTLRGGFTTTNWINSSLAINPTVIDPQGKGRGIYIAQSISTTVDGFIITNGNSHGLEGNQWGGGDAGGGVYVKNSNLTLRNSTIISNAALDSIDSMGGGIYADSEDTNILNLINNSFTLNRTSGFGAGLAIFGGRTTIISNTINNNENLLYGGGGLFVTTRFNTLITQNIIKGNSNVFYGGGIYLDGFGTTTISNNLFLENSASSGGGIYLGSYTGVIEITGNTIMSNTVGSSGGGIIVNDLEATISNNQIISNTAAFGGGVYLYIGSKATMYRNIIRGNSAEWGGGITFSGSEGATITENTIAYNSAYYTGGGLYSEPDLGFVPNLLIERGSVPKNLDHRVM